MTRNIPDQPDAPMRLRDAGGDLGELIEGADQQFQAGLPEAVAWRRLRERQRRRTAVSAGLLTAGVVGSLAAAAFLFRVGPGPGPGVTAERVLERSAEPSGQTAPKQDPTKLGSARGVRVQRARPDPALRPMRSASACRDLEARDRIQEAVACFEQLGSSSGLEAELALYEAGRLSADREPQRALRALEARRVRFPSGAMQVEAEWLRAQTLARSGKVQEALGVSEALLGNPASRTIANRLHLFRGKLYRDELHDCKAALTDFVSLLGEPGPIGDEGELSRALCLETLGRDDAQTAFERYLRCPKPAQAALAREHLAAIHSRSRARP